MEPAERIAQLEARLEALNATMANVLSTLVLHGVLTRPTVDHILREAAAHASAQGAAHGAAYGAAQVDALKAAVPAAMREAMGPPPDEDDHAH